MQIKDLMRYKGFLIQLMIVAGVVGLNYLYPHNPNIYYSWAAVPAIISGVTALYGGYQQNKARQKQDEQMKAQTAVGKETEGSAKQFLGQSQQAFGPALSYYSGMLNNPREATAPEQNRIGTLYNSQAANVRSQYPRGGYGLTAAENMRGQQRSATEGVIQNGRPMAAQGMSNLGSSLGQLGYQGYGLGAGIMGNVFNQGMQARQQQFNTGSAMGQGLFNAYNSYMLGQALKTPGTDNTGSGAAGAIGGSVGPGASGPSGNGFYGPM